MYENIGIKFSGHTAEMNKKLQEFEITIQTMQLKHEHELIIKDKNHELMLKDKDTELKLKDKDNELLVKEIQYKEREIELLNRLSKYH
jgi:hypothetical protein